MKIETLLLALILVPVGCAERGIVGEDGGGDGGDAGVRPGGPGDGGSDSGGARTVEALFPDCVAGFAGEVGFGCPEGSFGEYGYDARDCVSCTCTPSCDADAQCPSPADGSAQGKCADGYCVLSCEDGQRCPAGMECRAGGEILQGTVCMWTSDDPLVCSVAQGGPGCADITDPATCNATVSADAPWACHWVPESIVDVGVACPAEPIGGRCMLLTQAAGEFFGDVAVCASTGNMVGFEDFGAGTAAIVQLPPGWQPVSALEYALQPCDFSRAQPLPTACGCGCTG